MEVALVVGAYLLGSVPVGYLLGRRRGLDIRRYGSGGVGASNVWRTLGRRPGVLCGVADATKGALPIILARGLGYSDGVTMLAGVAAVAGHNWPVFLRFNGGRGVSLSLVVVLFVSPTAFFWALFPALAAMALGRDSAPAVALGMLLLPFIGWGLGQAPPLVAGYAALFGIMVLRRLTAPSQEAKAPKDRRGVLLNRLLFDRDERRRRWPLGTPEDKN